MGNHITEDEITATLVEVMTAAGSHPAFVHAVRELGFMVTEVNAHLMTDEMLSEWDDAIDDYMAAHPEAPPL